MAQPRLLARILDFLKPKPHAAQAKSSYVPATEMLDDEDASFNGRLLSALIGFSAWFQFKAQPVLRKFDWRLIRACALICAAAFVLASSVSTFAANSALNFAIKARSGDKSGAEGPLSVPMVAAGGGPSGPPVPHLKG